MELSDFAPLCLLLPFVIGGTLIYITFRRKARRAAKARAWAERHGFAYREFDGGLLELVSFDPFDKNRGRRVQNVLRGEHRGEPVLIFEYEEGQGNEKRKYRRWQVVAVPLPKPVPMLDVAEETKATRALVKDIEFENQAFNDRFRIRSTDRRFAFDVVHARTMEWMLTDPRVRELGWRFAESWLMTFREGEADHDERLARVDVLRKIRAQVPPHVWSDS